MLLLLVSLSLADDSCGSAGDSSLLAQMPLPASAVYPPAGPAYPEGTAVVGNRVIVSGPATFGTAGNNTPSQLTIFNRETGALEQQVPLVGENTAYEHALSELAAYQNYVYAPSTQLGVLRWKVSGNKVGTQESVSTPFCSVSIPAPCQVATNACPSNMRFGLPPLPNGIVVDKDGTSYVTDSLQGIIWKIPASGSPAQPEVFYCDPALQGSGNSGLSMFGANGIAISGDFLYVAVTFGPIDSMGPSSVIYRLSKSAPNGLQLVKQFEGVEVAPGVVVPPLADGLRMHSDGDLFVVLGGQNAIVDLDISSIPAVEVARYGGNDPAMPLTNPSTVAFSQDGESAYLSNHAITHCLPGDPNPDCFGYDAASLFGVVEMCVERDED